MSIKCLQSLSNTELMKSADQAVRAERTCKIDVILHLVEISRRKLHLDWGYPSLWKYCEERFAFSPAVIGHRLQVAAKCSEYPELLRAIVEGEMSLTVAGMVASKLDHDNRHEIISICANKTKTQVDEILVRYLPRKEVQPMIRRVSERAETGRFAQQCLNRESVAVDYIDHRIVTKMPNDKDHLPVKRLQNKIQAATPESFNFGFTGSKSLKKKIERLAALKGLHSRNALAALIEAGIDAELNRIDPLRIEKRLEKRRAMRERDPEKGQQSPEIVKKKVAKKGYQSPAIAGKIISKKMQRSPVSAMRNITKKNQPIPPNLEKISSLRQGKLIVNPVRAHISNDVKRKIRLAAGGRCQHLGPEGNRCTETVGVQIDHRLEIAAGGTNDRGNLQILCRAHNFRKAELRFGESFMTSKIAGSSRRG